MGKLLIGALEQLLKLGNLTLEERHRYDDNVLKLKKEWYEEFDKLESNEGSDRALGDVELQLRLTLEALLNSLGTKNS